MKTLVLAVMAAGGLSWAVVNMAATLGRLGGHALALPLP